LFEDLDGLLDDEEDVEDVFTDDIKGDEDNCDEDSEDNDDEPELVMGGKLSDVLELPTAQNASARVSALASSV
jgi:hypothetical protein